MAARFLVRQQAASSGHRGPGESTRRRHALAPAGPGRPGVGAGGGRWQADQAAGADPSVGWPRTCQYRSMYCSARPGAGRPGLPPGATPMPV